MSQAHFAPAPSAPPAGVPPSSNAPAAWEPEPQLDANRLHVYHVALELHALSSTLVGSLNRIVRDQLERPSLQLHPEPAYPGGPTNCRHVNVTLPSNAPSPLGNPVPNLAPKNLRIPAPPRQ